MKWFNPIPLGANTSAGTGKSHLFNLVAIKDLPTLVSRMVTYGGVDANLAGAALNLKSALIPFLPSKNAYSGLLTWAGPGDWKADENLEDTLSGTLGLRKLSDEEVRTELMRPEWMTSQSGEYQMLLPTVGAIDPMADYYIWSDGVQDQLLFGLVDWQLPGFYTGCTLSGKRITLAAQRHGSNFKGTGVPTFCAVEGMHRPTVGARFVVNFERNIDQLFGVVSSLNNILQAELLTTTVEEVRKLASSSEQWKTTMDAAIAVLANSANKKVFMELHTELTPVKILPAGSTKGDDLYSYGLAASSDDGYYLTNKSLINFLKYRDTARYQHLRNILASGDTEVGGKVTICKDNELRNERFDPFYNALVEPLGDVFLETFNQFFDVVLNHLDTTRKGGSSSGVTRGEDASTYTNVSCLYVNRGSVEDEEIRSGALAGLQSGNVVYTFNNEGHLITPIYQTHRLSERDIAHIWFLADEQDRIAFIDSPDDRKVRRCWMFQMDPGAPGKSVFLGYSELETLEIHSLPMSEFREHGGHVPQRREYLDLQMEAEHLQGGSN